ncbi:hypothetical protein AB1E18_018832 [Capra hircus]
MSSGASVSALQRLVEQLKLEAGVERIMVSQAAAELQQYCMQNACKDALLETITVLHNNLKQISDVVKRTVVALSPATVSA